MRVARADKDGHYTFPSLPAGDYYVAAVKDDTVDDWWDPSLLSILSRSARQLHLLDDQRIVQDLDTLEVR